MTALCDEKVVLELDKYEYGVVFHSLKDMRNEMLKENRSTDAVDDVLLKVIDLGEMQTDNQQKEKREKKGRKYYEAR